MYESTLDIVRQLTYSSADDGGHDVIDNFEFPRNLMENLISIRNFINTVMKNVK